MMTPKFTIIGAKYIKDWALNNAETILSITSDAYAAFHGGFAVNPNSSFLRFPDSNKNRIIALLASSEAEPKCAGIKWISSFPENINFGLDRASAVFVLNDRETGYPIACLEGSQISSYRTAASAIVGANLLHPTSKFSSHLVVVGCGLISYTTVSLMLSTGWKIDKLTIVDLNLDRAKKFAKKFNNLNIIISDKVVQGDMILFATSAVEPYFFDNDILNNNPTVLHMSLRDIGTNIIKISQNFVDDIDHSVQANTSLHLAEQELRNRKFITGDIGQLLKGDIDISFTSPRIFAPFGMGIIDLLVSMAIYKDAISSNNFQDIEILDNFFPVPYVIDN